MRNLYIVMFLASAIIPALTASKADAQAPPLVSSICYGSSQVDNASAVVATKDGGYIMAGTTNGTDQEVTTPNHGGYDCWVVKTDAAGKIQWSQTYGGSNDDNASFIDQTPDGGYILAATTTSSDGEVIGSHASTSANDVWIVKLDSVGNIMWQTPLGNSLSNFLGSVAMTNDGGYVVAASELDDGSNSTVRGLADVWVVKLSSTGTVLWSKTFGGTDNDLSQDVIVDNHNRIVIAASTLSDNDDVTYNHGKTDEWVLCLDSTGNLIWQNTYGGSDDDIPTRIIQTQDGGYALSGYTYSDDGEVTGHHADADVWIVKIDADGNLTWQKDIGGSLFDQGASIMQAANGTYSVIGSTTSEDGDISGLHGSDIDALALQLSNSGSLLWTRCLGGSFEDQGMDLAPAGVNGYMFFSTTYSGDGDVSGNHGEFDMWLAHLAYPTEGVAPLNPNPEATVYPTLTTGEVNVKSSTTISDADITLYDMVGHKCDLVYNASMGTLDMSALPAGNYLLYIRNMQKTYKITKE